jgi:membrane protein implicated in regulation of membrane protease activity
MADKQSIETANGEPNYRPVQFQTRHIICLITATCILLGIPGGMFVVGVVVAPWIWFFLIICPLILIQFLFVLLVPALRRRLLPSRGSTSINSTNSDRPDS